MYSLFVFILFISASGADVLYKGANKGASLKPLSVCCDIPEIGNAKPLSTCSNRDLQGLCSEIECIFEESGFLINNDTLNKEAYSKHLIKWGQDHEGWSAAVDEAIEDCVDEDLRQRLDQPCKAIDVFACTGITLLKNCPKTIWKC